MVLFRRGDPELLQDDDRLARLQDAIERVDRYLQDECGADIPTRDGST
jgi:hypothetical protein